jgi:hypothetical protein
LHHRSDDDTNRRAAAGRARELRLDADPRAADDSVARRSSVTRRARLIGMAKPRPIEPPLGEKIELLTPITSPAAFTRGPPEFPGLMAASV